MPAETRAHERTLMAWPVRDSLWGKQIAAAKREYAGVANAIAAFEPVTMCVTGEQAAAEVRAACDGNVEPLVLKTDDSWMRDNGPIFVTDSGGSIRAGIHFRFNGWGSYSPHDSDERAGGELAGRFGDETIDSGIVLEGGSIAVDGEGLLATTEECLLHPSRNPTLGRDEIEAELRAMLGADEVLWFEHGLVEDRDTDGHVDLICDFVGPRRMLLQSTAPANPNHDNMARNHEIARAAGVEVIDFPLLAYATVAGEQVVCSYLNFYAGDRFCVVPVFGQDELDDEACARIGDALPGREIVPVPATVIAYGGGGPHCITQQVPALTRQPG